MGDSVKTQPSIRILFGAAVALGPGKVDLLEAIAETGSISAAARGMKMSYRRAWTLVDAMNKCFCSDLVRTATGGQGGGGAAVTDLGLEVLARYRAIEAKAARSVEAEIANFSDLLVEKLR
jgi:molybdate transport system regulatory protein